MSWNQRWEEFQKSADNCLRFLKAEDFMHVTFISLKYNYLFVETPKVACSTIKRLLINAEYEGKVTISQGEALHYREFSPLLNIRQVGNVNQFLNRSDIFKFCFVRNPYTRLLSCYLDKVLRRLPQSHQLMYELGYGLFSDKVLSFSEFIEAVLAQPMRYMDWHWRTQYYTTFQNCIKYDFIGKFENFETDFQKVMQDLDINFAQYYQTVNAHATQANEKLKEYYTSELVEKVYQKFKIDFDHFGYSQALP